MNERHTVDDDCPGCTATDGETHDLGCDHERCPKCGEQLIGCPHIGEYEKRAEEREIAEDLLEWCDFSGDRAYILMAIARRKFNEDVTNASEIIHRRVLTDDEDVEEQVRELLAMMEVHGLHFRLYLTVNARDTVSAYHSFLQTLVGWSEEAMNGHDPVYEKMGKISSEWKSVLHKPEHKTDSLFLIDYDDVTSEGIGEVVKSLDQVTTIVDLRETPNGYHLITEPFDYPNWSSPVEYDELDTDGMTHVFEVDAR